MPAPAHRHDDAPTCQFSPDLSGLVARLREDPSANRASLREAGLSPTATEGWPAPPSGHYTISDIAQMFGHALKSGLVTVPLAVHGCYITATGLEPDSRTASDPQTPAADALLWVVRPDGKRTSIPAVSLRPSRHFEQLGATKENASPVVRQHAMLAAMVESIEQATRTMWEDQDATTLPEPAHAFLTQITALTEAQWAALRSIPLTPATSARFEDAFDAARFVRDAFGTHLAAGTIAAAMHTLYATGRGEWTGGRWVLYAAAALAASDRVGDPSEPAWTTSAHEALTRSWRTVVGPLPA